MATAAQLKFVKSLRQKKYSLEYGVFVAETPKVVEDILIAGMTCETVFATKEWLMQQEHLLTQVKTEEVKPSELERMSGLVTPNQVLAVVKRPNRKYFDKSVFDGLSLLLDDIRDPGNMGTIIRVADWFGIKRIFCSLNSVDVFHPKVVQGTMGSIARVDLYEQDLEDLLSRKPADFPVYTTVLSGENIYETSLAQNAFILIGSEAHGISEKLLALADKRLTIPHFSINENRAESLNAAVATAIVCSEFRRRT